MKKAFALFLAMMLILPCGLSLAESGNVPAKIDMTKWQYESADDVYWQVGLSYAATPASTIS